MPVSKKPRKSKSVSSKKKAGASSGFKPTLELLGEREISYAAMEGGRIVMDRLRDGLSARPGGDKGEILVKVVCPGCGIRVSMEDAGGMLYVNYEPKNTSDYCLHGLKDKPKGVYCPVLSPILNAAHSDFNEAVYEHTFPDKETDEESVGVRQ